MKFEMATGYRIWFRTRVLSLVGKLEMETTCSRRQRATQPGVSPWELLLDTLNSTVHSLQVEVVNSRTLARLQLQLVALADSTLRIQLDELIVTRPRYKVEHSLAGEPQTDRWHPPPLRLLLRVFFLISRLDWVFAEFYQD